MEDNEADVSHTFTSDEAATLIDGEDDALTTKLVELLDETRGRAITSDRPATLLITITA